MLTRPFSYSNGNKSEYNGGRTKDTIIEWINKKTGPVSLEVNCADMETKTSESNLSVSYFGASEGDLWESYMKSARNPAISEKFQFFHTSDGDCAAKFETSAPGVSISRRFDESPLAYSGAAVEDDIVAFAKGASVPRLITFSEDYIEPIFGDRNPAVILFTEEADQGYQSVFAQAAKDLQGELLFVTSGVTEGIQSKLAEFVGVSASDMPTMRLVHPAESMQKYVYEGDASALTGDDVAKFISDFKAGNLQPHLKSQDVSAATTVDGLTIVVGKTWNDVVADPSKDVLVKYYAPWCGHCKSLAPIWEELAKDVEGMDDLIIAKMDSTENEVTGVEVQGFPTLIFYPKDNKTGVKFEGDRDLSAFKTYLNENSSAYQAARPAGETEGEPVQEEL